jgi:hypothetical protein
MKLSSGRLIFILIANEAETSGGTIGFGDDLDVGDGETESAEVMTEGIGVDRRSQGEHDKARPGAGRMSVSIVCAGAQTHMVDLSPVAAVEVE